MRPLLLTFHRFPVIRPEDSNPDNSNQDSAKGHARLAVKGVILLRKRQPAPTTQALTPKLNRNENCQGSRFLLVDHFPLPQPIPIHPPSPPHHPTTKGHAKQILLRPSALQSLSLSLPSRDAVKSSPPLFTIKASLLSSAQVSPACLRTDEPVRWCSCGEVDYWG